MMKILIVGHGNLPKVLVETAEMIYGSVKNVTYLCFESHQNIDEYMEDLKTICLDSHEVLVLADILGGSPFMQMARLSNEIKSTTNIEIVTGVNLGMLIEVISQKENKTLNELRDLAKQTGCQSITDLKTWMKR
jgi:mannose PTS system EIIA component